MKTFGSYKGTFPRIVSILILVGVLSEGPVLAQDRNEEYRINKRFLNQFKHDLGETISSPYHWDSKSLLNFSAVMSGGLLLYTVDQDINFWFQQNKNTSSEELSTVVSSFGHGIFLSSLIVSFYTGGELFNSVGLRKTALLSLESWLTSGMIVWGVKFITGRARPYTDEKSSSFRPFSLNSSFHSFPSGHSSSAFAVATVIADQTEAWGVDVLVYSLASLVAISRVHDEKHWASDVLVGSALGYFIGKKICELRGESKKCELSFSFTQHFQGITLTLHF